MEVSFLGLGRMGTPMAGHVVAAGHRLRVWNRSADRTAALTAVGAVAARTPAEAARGAEVVVLMLADPPAVSEVLFGADGVVAGAREGLLVIDASTIGPAAARENARRLRSAGLRYLDAPVLGSVQAAIDGTLTVVASGSANDYAAAEPLLHTWGAPERVRRVGGVGAASALKVVVNLTIGVAITGVGEALRLASDLGVEPGTLLDAMAAGPFGWTLGQKRPMLEAGDYSPTSFSVDLLAKDLALAVDAAHEELPATAAALAATRAAAAAGHGNDDYAAVAGFLGLEGSPDSY